MNFNRLLLVASIFGVIGIVGWLTLGRPNPIKVTLHQVGIGTVEHTVANTRTGSVKACRRSQLAPLISGRIEHLSIHKGSRVEAGQTLIGLWNRDLQAQVATQRKELAAAHTQADQSCILARQATAEAARLKPLHDQGMVSEDQYSQVESTALAQRAACNNARDGIQTAQSRLVYAETNLKRSQLIAPFSGIVAELNAELGEIVAPGTTVVDLIDTSCLYISAPIDEIDAPNIRTGMVARISIDAFPQQPFNATVRRVAPYVLDVEKQSRTVEVEASVDDAEARNKLAPGYSADIEIVLSRRDKVIWIPTSAILTDNHVLVYSADSGVLEKRRIKTGLSNWQRTEVTGGLKAGERIVTSTDRDGVSAGAHAVPE